VTLPIGQLADFVAAVAPRLEQAAPGVRLVTYGHVGDGNLHYNLSRPVDGDDGDFLARRAELSRIVYDEVSARRGSISAEHGLGVLKRDAAAAYKPAVEVALMRAVKEALDPDGLMNPGKVVPPAVTG
jgi:FAD/FMN-containing dehydrogenase